MIGTSWWDYVQIRVCIAGFRLVTPTCLVYLGASLLYQHFLVSTWIGLYAITEASFLFFVYLPRRSRMQKMATHPPALSPAERLAIFQKCADHISAGDTYPTGWFTSPEFKRQNVVDWILWALFSSDNADQAWEDEINVYVEVIEKLLGRKLEQGKNENAKSMRLTLDPVVMVHRPLIWYIIVSGVDGWSSLSLSTCGFRHYATPKWFHVFPPRPHTLLSRPSVDPDLPYWYRPHRSSTKLPVLFLHGIGIGLWPYIPLLKELISGDPDVGILAIELMPVSMRITGPLLSRSATCLAVTRILDSLNIPRFVLVSHSYGTIITAHMFHSPDLAPRISSMLFIDPIPFLLHLPNVAFNFVYRKPRSANEWQLWYFASRDPDISRALSRHFFWAENVLWKEELEGKRTAIVLSGADQIVHANEVRKYLTGEEEAKTYWEKDDLEVLFFPQLDHATVFDTKKRRRPILDVMRRFINPA